MELSPVVDIELDRNTYDCLAKNVYKFTASHQFQQTLHGWAKLLHVAQSGMCHKMNDTYNVSFLQSRHSIFNNENYLTHSLTFIH